MSDNAKEILPVNIEEELKNSYLDYAMSVIVGRALPDVRDGLKPVHRRVLFAMNELKNDFNKPYKKSARVVGDVIGKYHPHGDSAVYDTIVRMAQPFSLRYMLVDGQGNFGSVDGDSAAAMRYTEVRMAKMASEVLADLDKDTVDFVNNYDDTLTMPEAWEQMAARHPDRVAVTDPDGSWTLGELDALSTRLGGALLTLLRSLGLAPEPEQIPNQPGYLTLFAWTAHVRRVPVRQTLLGFTWAWLENQLAVACKALPLGHTAAQRIIERLRPQLAVAVNPSPF